MNLLPRAWALFVLAAVLVPVTLFQPYANGPAIRSDGVGYHLWTHAFLQGQLTFEWYDGEREASGIIYVAERAIWINKYPPGVALVRFPFMWPFVDRTQPGHIRGGEHAMALILAALALLLTAGFLLRTCHHLGVSSRTANGAVLLLTFGTGLFHYATYDGSFSHVYSALGVAVLMWLGRDITPITPLCETERGESVVGWLQCSLMTGSPSPFRRGGWGVRSLLTVLTIALLILVRNTNVFFVLLWGLTCGLHAYRHSGSWRRNAITLGLGLALGVGLQVLLNHHTQGRLTLSSYGSEAFLWNRPMQLSVLCSYERGLFVYYPLLAVVLVVGLVVRRTRLATLAYIGVLACYTVLYGYWHSWMLGGGFGHRGFVEFIPVAVPIFAVAVEGVGKWRRVVWALASVSTLMTLCLMGGYWLGAVPDTGATRADFWNNCYRLDYLARMWGDAG